MDFGGALGVDAFVPEGRSLFYSSLSSGDAQGSGKGGAFANVSYKHDRPAEAAEYDWRAVKMARSDALTTAAGTANPLDLRSNSQPLFPDGEKMLSFSTASQQGVDAAGDANLTYGGACHSPAPTSSTHCYLRNAGLYSGNSNSNMQGVLARVRGPFTPSQWLELEHQALIYKYLVANVPVPPTLLIPIRKSLSASGFPTLSAGSFGSVGWGSFQLYAGIADPEPGRCRRTDGKKWRCSRDAVADQKYCERHMNRGRHRSRKHVEGHAGHASKAMPAIASSQSASAVPDGSSSGSLTMSQHKSKNLQSNITNPSLGQFNGLSMSMEDQNGTSKMILSMPNPASQKLTNALYPVAKQHNPFEETSSGTDIGLISSDSFLNIASSSLSNSISLIPNPKLSDQHIQAHPLRQFIDVCRKTNSDHSAVTWPEIEESNSDRTQLSISIPMACSDFSSSSSSNHDKLALSPLRLSREHDPIPMGLGVGLLNEVCHHHANWRPISWEASLAGPLGEVLNSTNSTTPRDQSRNFLSSASQNILSDGWDSGHHQMESSPTGVLQKNSFSSLSSSTGSSPRAESLKIHENNGSLCNNLLGSAIEVQQMR